MKWKGAESECKRRWSGRQRLPSNGSKRKITCKGKIIVHSIAVGAVRCAAYNFFPFASTLCDVHRLHVLILFAAVALLLRLLPFPNTKHIVIVSAYSHDIRLRSFESAPIHVHNSILSQIHITCTYLHTCTATARCEECERYTPHRREVDRRSESETKTRKNSEWNKPSHFETRMTISADSKTLCMTTFISIPSAPATCNAKCVISNVYIAHISEHSRLCYSMES